MLIVIRLRYLILLLLICSVVNAQVLNIDREQKEDSSIRKWNLSVGISLSSDKQKSNLFESSSNLETVLNLHSRYFLAAVFRNDLSYNGPAQIQNEGLFHIRFRDRDTRKSSIELFMQSMWNGQWGLLYRNSIGIGYRQRVIEKEGLDCYMGFGIISDDERWNWNGVRSTLVPIEPKEINANHIRANQQIPQLNLPLP